MVLYAMPLGADIHHVILGSNDHDESIVHHVNDARIFYGFVRKLRFVDFGHILRSRVNAINNCKGTARG